MCPASGRASSCPRVFVTTGTAAEPNIVDASPELRELAWTRRQESGSGRPPSFIGRVAGKAQLAGSQLVKNASHSQDIDFMQVANHPKFVKEPRRSSCQHLINCQLQPLFLSCGYDECDCDTKSRFRTPQTSTGGLSLLLLFGSSVGELGLASRAAQPPHRGQGRPPARSCRKCPRRRSGLCLSLRLLQTLSLCSVLDVGEVYGAVNCAQARCLCAVVPVWALLSSTILSLLGHSRAQRHQRCEPSQPAHDGRLRGKLPCPYL